MTPQEARKIIHQCLQDGISVNATAHKDVVAVAASDVVVEKLNESVPDRKGYYQSCRVGEQVLHILTQEAMTADKLKEHAMYRACVDENKNNIDQ